MLQVLLMHVAAFKYNKSSASLVANYSSCFPPGWYYKNFLFDLILKWDVEVYKMELMTK